jgi:tRNA(fMet)-specific endonuclease VapC
MIVLDTDILIEIFDKKSEIGEEALQRIVGVGESLAMTAVNLHEIIYGFQKYGKSVGEVKQLPVLAYTKEDAILAATLELKAEKKGTPILRTDAMIAAMVINNGAKLFTLDLKHFGPLETLGLKLLK